MKSIYKYLLWLSLVLLIVCAALYFTDNHTVLGPALILFFLAISIGVRGYKNVKGFSFALLIFACVTLAMYYPSAFLKWGSFELKTLVVPLLQIIMFGMGTAMSLKDFGAVVKSPKAVFIGLACQFTIMPIVGLILTIVFDFPAEIAAGVILIGSSPSGLASNVMAYIGKANLALSVTLTTVATLLAPFITPVLMKTLGDQLIPIDFWGMMWGITKITILPIIGGLIFNATVNKKMFSFLYKRSAILIPIVLFLPYLLYKIIFEKDNPLSIVGNIIQIIELAVIFPCILGLFFYLIKKANAVNSIMPLVSMGGIAFILTIITAAGRDNLLTMGVLLVVVGLIHNSSGYFLGYWACRLFGLDEKSCRTIAFEVGMQNAGLASGLAIDMNKVATVGLAPAIFGPMMNITGSSLATWWRDKPIKKKTT